jgi:hypothetical protein
MIMSTQDVSAAQIDTAAAIANARRLRSQAFHVLWRRFVGVRVGSQINTDPTPTTLVPGEAA